MPRIGIVTGLLEEAESFRSGAGRARRRHPFYVREGDDGWMVACAGIGKVNAAMAASELVASGCDLLVSMGVAGRIGQDDQPVYWLKAAYQHDYGSYRPKRFVPFRAGSLPFGEARPEAFSSISDPGLSLPTATILTGDAFVEDSQKAAGIARDFSAELVDMETGAIAQVAAMHKVGWAGIRAVSDAADPEGVKTFKANLHQAATLAARHVDMLVDLLQRD